MKVYVVIESWACDYDCGNSLEVYSTQEKALEDLEERKRNARIDFGLDNETNNETDDIVEEQEEDSYTIYEDGYYSKNHISIRIEEKEIK